MNPLPFGAPQSQSQPHFLDALAELRLQESRQPVTPPTLLEKASSLKELTNAMVMEYKSYADFYGTNAGVKLAQQSYVAAMRAVTAAERAGNNKKKLQSATAALKKAKDKTRKAFDWEEKHRRGKGGTLRRKHRKSVKPRKS